MCFNQVVNVSTPVRYRLCWCAAGYACDRVEHFRVDVGEMRLVGPSPVNAQERTCVSGQTSAPAQDGLLELLIFLLPSRTPPSLVAPAQVSQNLQSAVGGIRP